jgi:hypothetical protein
MRWLRDEDDCFLVLGRCGCGCGLDFGTKIVSGRSGLGGSVFVCLLVVRVSEEGAQDTVVEGASALLVGWLVVVRRCDVQLQVSWAVPHEKERQR